MREVGIDIAGQTPNLLDHDTVRGSDVIVTMGCGDACPFFPGKRYEDWKLDDPAGRDLDTVRRIRDDIRDRVAQRSRDTGYSGSHPAFAGTLPLPDGRSTTASSEPVIGYSAAMTMAVRVPEQCL